MVARLPPVAAKLLSGPLTGQLPCLSPQVSPVTSACDSFPPLPNVKLSSSSTPPSLFFPAARLLLYPYSSSTAALKSVPFLVSAPSISIPLLCPHLSCLLSLLAFFFFFGFSPSLTLCFACSLSICLPLSVHACAALTPGPSESQCTFLSVGLFLSGWLWVFVFISPLSPNRSQPETPWGSRV